MESQRGFRAPLDCDVAIAGAGLGGLVASFAEALEAAVGRILLGLAPWRLTFEGARCTGFVARSPGQLALAIRARHTIAAVPGSRFPSGRSSSSFRVRLARSSWCAAPRRSSPSSPMRSAGTPGSAADPGSARPATRRTTPAGTASSRDRSRTIRAASTSRPSPPAPVHHPVGSCCTSSSGAGIPPCRDDWPSVRARAERVIRHLRTFYADLDTCIEWSAFQVVCEPAFLSWYRLPVPRHPVEVPGLDNLLRASSALESDADPLDIAAHAGRLAAARILGTDPRELAAEEPA